MNIAWVKFAAPMNHCVKRLTGTCQDGVRSGSVVVKSTASAIIVVGRHRHWVAISLGMTNLGVGVGSFTDKDNDTDAVGDQLTPTGPLQDPNRRRFSRNALAGSAVLLSLGNRSAWGGQTMGVMSLTTLNSFNPATGMFISAPAGTLNRTSTQTNKPGHNVELAKEIHRISSPPDYLGTDGKYSTCKDPKSFDSIVLVKGKCSS